MSFRLEPAGDGISALARHTVSSAAAAGELHRLGGREEIVAPEYLKGLVFFLGLEAVILAAAAFGEWYVQRKVERWARAHGLRLLEFSGAPFWRGPRAWRRTDDQEDYRVVVEDAAGRRRTGWLLYTSRWRGLGPQRVEVRWDD
jgi:hypothetical protein